jgi:acyl-coenzyme A synthetase/AMP-(fatty) acid ligase
VSATNGVPTIIAMLLEAPNIDSYDPSSLRLITYGGSPIDPTLLGRAMAKFSCGFQQHYGMTEAGSACMLKAEDHDPEDIDALTSAGCDAAGYELRVVDDEGRQLPNGAAGEIILRGPGLMKGYWGLPDKTAESLIDGYAFGSISMAAYTLDAKCPTENDATPSAGLPDPAVVPPEDANV